MAYTLHPPGPRLFGANGFIAHPIQRELASQSPGQGANNPASFRSVFPTPVVWTPPIHSLVFGMPPATARR